MVDKRTSQCTFDACVLQIFLTQISFIEDTAIIIMVVNMLWSNNCTMMWNPDVIDETHARENFHGGD